ncbi:MAG: hypothetical protein ABL933_12845 [Methyloglobulus sp.]|nr:hypothetical protein [Methyloglobulus sp.]
MSDNFSDENKKFLSEWLSDEPLQKMTAQEAKVFREKFLEKLEERKDPKWVTNEKQFQVSRQRIREIEEKALKKLRNRGGGDNDPSVA